MGSSAKAPKTPDYSALAKQQAQSDKDIAMYLTQANRPNQSDPYGQTTWTQEETPEYLKALGVAQQYERSMAANPQWDSAQAQAQLKQYQDAANNLKGQGKWTQTTTYTPEQQALLNQQQQLQGMQNSKIMEMLGSFQTPTLQSRDLPAQRQLKEADYNNINELLYGQLTRDFGDRFAREEAANKANLANMGFQMGSEGYQNALSDFNKQKNDAYLDAQTQAALSSYDQMNKERALNQSEYGMLSSDDLNRWSALTSNDLNNYNSQMSVLSQLLGGGQGPTGVQFPGFAQATQYQSPDLLGAAQASYNGNLNQTNASNASRGQLLGTLGTLGAAGITA